MNIDTGTLRLLEYYPCPVGQMAVSFYREQNSRIDLINCHKSSRQGVLTMSNISEKTRANLI